jgi:Malectin domain
VFDVWIEGALAISNLDIVQAAGGFSTAYVVPVQTSVSDGSVTVAFVPVVENPMITAIEIIKWSAPTPVALPVASPVSGPISAPVTVPTAPTFKDILINCGGKFFGPTVLPISASLPNRDHLNNLHIIQVVLI